MTFDKFVDVVNDLALDLQGTAKIGKLSVVVTSQQQDLYAVSSIDWVPETDSIHIFLNPSPIGKRIAKKPTSKKAKHR